MTIEFDGQNNKLGTTTANSVTIKTNDTDAITVDSSQKIGIGTSSPTQTFEVSSTQSVPVKITHSDGASCFISLNDSSTTDGTEVMVGAEGNNMVFHAGDLERMRIDSSGSVMFGTTDNNPANNSTGTSADNGISINRDNESTYRQARYSANLMYLNRTGTDGSIIAIYNDATPAGAIGNFGDDMYMGTGTCGIRYNSSNLTPFNVTNVSNSDNALDLGHPSIRWDDIYATNGTIQTSDQNEKQSIQSLTSSEIAVAKRISKLFKTYKFNSAVEEKGDSARTHTGVIAQDVQQAFTDEGLDASDYALFISSTWWEKEISVDAVAEELDEEGNVIVEGKDAYTYIDTKEEATEGYTEKTRLGIRYPELLSFVSSAFEQRLTNIETRLEALENV